MARANPQPKSDDTPDPQEWQALRSELVTLLAEVEGRYAPGKPAEASSAEVAGRMTELRAQIANPPPPAAPAAPPAADDRRRQALRSVKRAVERLNEREEHEAPAVAEVPREALKAAIGEIRARQKAEAAAPAAPARPAAPAAPPAPDPTPRFDALARAVENISARLERLDGEIKGQRHSGAGIKEIADQVSQVSHVVELLAGAVGETGQVKRLESQIAGLARLISDTQRVDMGALTKRIDEVSSTVERLADLQIQHVAREREMPALAQRLDEVSATVERLADLQLQHVNRERDMPALNARIGEVLETVERLAALQAESSAHEREIVPALGQRIGDVSESLERLVDMQTMHVRAVKDVPAQHEALRAGMQVIEKGVRNVYDRIDAIEKNYVLPPAEFEKLTSEMARFTLAMQEASQPQGLLELVDSLNARVSEIQSRDGEVGALKDEISGLRGAVIEAIEPRMAAMETRLEALTETSTAIAGVAPRVEAIQTQLEALSERGAALYDVGPRMDDIRAQLEALNERVAERPAHEPSMGQIEAQVRQLVARMDQTGEQLSGLARLYTDADERGGTPDYEAIAELVAARTSQAMRDGGLTGGMSAEDISEFEQRMSRLFKTLAADSTPGTFTDVTDGIRRVDERLERLEAALNRLADESGTTADASAPVFATEEPEAAPLRAAMPVIESDYDDEPQQVFSAAMPPRRPDTMPHGPAEERPLVDRGFPDLGPVRSALEARLGRPRHPGLSDEPADLGANAFSGSRAVTPAEDEGAPMAPPSFDPATVPRPPRPESSLGVVDREAFNSGTVPSSGERGSDAPAGTPAAARSAFIEAARKAAQRQADGRPETAQGSLIARALARFQGGGGGKAKAAAPEPEAAPAKPGRKARGKAADTVETRVEPAPATKLKAAIAPEPELPAEAPVPRMPAAPAADAPANDEARESFLTRHRQPILLAASVVALAFLTLNLVNQRMAEQQAQAAFTPQEVAAATPATPAPAIAANVAQVKAPAETPARPVATAPRVISMTDSLQTGSIDPAAAKAFVAPGDMPAMPQAFAPATSGDAGEPQALASPVKVEMPPENVGPIELRQAAADGDARAQFEIGAIYTEGRAVPQDLKLAATWYERAAAQGFAPAQYRLGNLYENGKGVTRDLEQARLWYQRAAESGNRMSMHNLAALYAGGDLGKQEFASAAEWFEKAANEGLTDSQFNLGMLYARGLGVPQNMGTSYKWFAIAARSGDKDAANARDDVAKSLDAEAVTRLNAEVDAWKPAPVDLAANFAPIGTWSSTFDPGETITTREVVVGVQTLLSRLGYDVGTPDGVAGPKTAEAIKEFERATGMSESGAINPRLLAVLSSQPV